MSILRSKHLNILCLYCSSFISLVIKLQDPMSFRNNITTKAKAFFNPILSKIEELSIELLNWCLGLALFSPKSPPFALSCFESDGPCPLSSLGLHLLILPILAKNCGRRYRSSYMARLALTWTNNNNNFLLFLFFFSFYSSLVFFFSLLFFSCPFFPLAGLINGCEGHQPQVRAKVAITHLRKGSPRLA